MYENHQRGAALGAEACGQSVGYTESACASNTVSRDRAPTISTTVDVPACYGFDTALRAMFGGSKVTRAGWNARGQHVEIQRPDKHSRMTSPYAVLKNSDGGLVPWVPSQGDLFAHDWAVLPT